MNPDLVVLEVNVCGCECKKVVLQVLRDQPMWSVCVRVEAEAKAAPGTLRLSYNGRALDGSERTPREMQMDNGSTLDGHAHMRGGEGGPSGQLLPDSNPISLSLRLSPACLWWLCVRLCCVLQGWRRCRGPLRRHL